jgi:hypothetical protein
MVGMVILAVPLGLAVTVHRRWKRCERMADYHNHQARAWAAVAWDGQQGIILIGPRPARSDEEFLQFFRNERGAAAGLALERCIEHRRLSEAYRKAAARPWTLPVRPFEPKTAGKGFSGGLSGAGPVEMTTNRSNRAFRSIGDYFFEEAGSDGVAPAFGRFVL